MSKTKIFFNIFNEKVALKTKAETKEKKNIYIYLVRIKNSVAQLGKIKRDLKKFLFQILFVVVFLYGRFSATKKHILIFKVPVIL